MDVNQENGQSVIEFVLMLPMFIGLTIVLLRVNTAIQVSIANQQYARGFATFMVMNSPFYPVVGQKLNLISQRRNQLVLGVSDDLVGNNQNMVVTPKATVQMVPRTQSIRGSNDSQEEPRLRAMVRIRNTVTLCTPSVVLSNGINISEGQNLNEGSQMNSFCMSELKYEQ